MADMHLGTGGKRVRALIPLAVTAHHDLDVARMLPFAAACELLHNATLVHDDLQDGDVRRRDAPSVWAQFGEARAINCGDAMLFWAVAAIDDLCVDSLTRYGALSRLVSSAIRIVDGQDRELRLRRGGGTLSWSTYIRVVQGKTSGLFSLPFAGAVQICGADDETIRAAEAAANELGILFQLLDDVIDLYGDKGRGVRGRDVVEGKMSSLAVQFLEHAPADDRRWLIGVLESGEPTTDQIGEVAKAFRDSGALARVLTEVDKRRRRALDIVPSRYSGLIAMLVELFTCQVEPIDRAERRCFDAVVKV
jgi:geranylgeranyl pyrophosphate synthase